MSRALVARLDGAGDVLMAGPAVRAMATRYGPVTFLCGPAGREAAHILPGVEEVLEFDAPWVPLDAKPFDARALTRIRSEIAARGHDVALVLTSFHQSPLPLALLLKSAGVARVAGTSEDHPGSLLDVRRRPEWDEGRHEVERSLLLAADLGACLPADDPGDLRVDLGPRVADRRSDPYVVVHPGASVPAREIPASTAAGLVDLLHGEGVDVVVTGSPSERGLVEQVAGVHRRGVTTMVEGSLRDLAGVLARASCAVVGNTGPAHLAAAVAVPVVSVFAPVVPVARWRPWRAAGQVLGFQDIECAGCRSRACPRIGQPCLAPATPAALASAALTWVGAW
jgi:ADP-heptose:LPS heptosyltransferase